MTSSGRGTTVVSYNVQAAVDTTHHLIVAHEVTNATSDRAQLTPMGQQAQEATGRTAMTVLADRSYFSGRQIVACEKAGMMPCVPKPHTSGAKAEGRFGKQDFVYVPGQNVYRCPPGRGAADLSVRQRRKRHDAAQLLDRRLRHLRPKTRLHDGPTASDQALGARRRAGRHAKRLDRVPQAMILRRQTVEHPFGAIKAWMDSTHLLTRTLKRVGTEMSLQVLAYNMKRVIAILGVRPMMEAIWA